MIEEPEALAFTSGWVLDGLRDSTSFFQNLHLVLLPDAMLVLEENSMAKDVRMFVEARAAQEQVRIARGTWWPRSRMHWLVPTEETLKRLAELSLNHAEPELCDHLFAVRDGRLILIWYDVFSNPLYISSEVEDESVSAFGRAVHVRPEPWQKD